MRLAFRIHALCKPCIYLQAGLLESKLPHTSGAVSNMAANGRGVVEWPEGWLPWASSGASGLPLCSATQKKLRVPKEWWSGLRAGCLRQAAVPQSYHQAAENGMPVIEYLPLSSYVQACVQGMRACPVHIGHCMWLAKCIASALKEFTPFANLVNACRPAARGIAM